MKKTVAVIFGGKSAEHDVSIITAHTPIIEALLANGGYNVVPVYIAQDGSWYSDEAMNDIAYFKNGDIADKLAKQKKLQLSFEKGLTLIKPGFSAKKITVDIVFPAMHGTFGEDGSLMGLLRMAGVPFVGCDLSASAVAMDKVLTKQVVAAEGLNVVPYVWFTKHEWETNKEALVARMQKLHAPYFVKPVHLGSSIAITKAKNADELEQAIEVALHYDDKVLVEESVEDLTEVTLPIMGNDELQCAGIEKPLNQTEFFDFSDKYLSQGGKSSEGGSASGGKTSGVNTNYSEIPAQIEDELTKQVLAAGETVYRALGCTGIARVDFLIDNKNGTVYVNEVNTLPGSLYQHNWRQVGVSSGELVTKLIELGFARFENDAKLTRTFRSAILEQRGGTKTQEA